MKKRGVKKDRGLTQPKENKQQTSQIWTGNIHTDIFPPYFQYIVFIICLVVRIHYVCQPTNWWILHPDEVYQSLDVAHSEVYGYGFRPYEYLQSEPSPNDTYIRQRELQLGMAAMRSFLYPRFFVMVSYILNIINIDVRPFLAWKVAHVCVTSVLPVAVYKFSRKLFSSHDVGCLSCLLVATSVHLNVFGTHTLINSFLAPAVFLCVSVFISPGRVSNSSDTDTTSLYEDHTKNSSRTLKSNCISEENTERQSKGKGSSISKGKQVRLAYSVSNTKLDQHDHKNDNYVRDNNYNTTTTCNGNTLYTEINSHSKTELLNPTADRIGNLPIDSLLKNLEFLPNGVQGVKKFDSKCKMINHPELCPSEVTKYPFNGILNKCCPCDVSATIASFILSTCCYIRPDLAMFCFVICVVHCKSEKLSLMWHLKATLGVITALIVCIFEDFAVYGVGVISPLNWFLFNVWRSFSGVLFGAMEFSFYLNVIFFDCYVNLSLSMIGLLFICLTIYKQGVTQNAGTVCRLLFSFLLIFICYSFQDHKESRHVHNLFCVFYIIIAAGIVYFINMNCSVLLSRLFMLLLIVSTTSNLLYSFPSPRDKSNKQWVYRKLHHSNDVNTCLDYVAGNDDVTGVFLDSNVHMTGGFSILHKNVPMLAFLTYEFYEFDNLSTRDKNFVKFSKASDFISILNTPYLMKILLQNRKYNYLILETNRNFIDFGYRQVFSSGQINVLRRSNETTEEKRLLKLAESIPIGSNATVLNYEGNWLMYLGAMEKARIRLEASLSLDQSLVNSYQMLSNIYNKSGQKRKALKLMQRCFNVVDKEKCTERSRPAVLHPNYDISF